MLTRLRLRNFKLFDEVDIELGRPVVLVGPNNSGKTSALQALALWDIGLRAWMAKRGGRPSPEKQPGAAINRRDLTQIPVPRANLLWRGTDTRKRVHESADEGAIAKELISVQPRPHASSDDSSSRPALTRPMAQGAQALLTALVLDEPARWTQAQERVSLDDIADPALRRILEVVGELEGGGHSAGPAQVISRLADEGQGALVTELVSTVQSLSSKDQAFEECLRRVRAHAQKQLLEQLRDQMRVAQDAGADTEVRRLLTAYQEQVKGG